VVLALGLAITAFLETLNRSLTQQTFDSTGYTPDCNSARILGF
jgi:hypothetical protein